MADETNDPDNLAYKMSVALEESLEMFGALLFLFVNLLEMSKEERVQIIALVEAQ